MTTTGSPRQRATARVPEQVCDLFALHASDRDVEGLVSLYEPAAHLVMPSGRVAHGADQLRLAWSELSTRAASGSDCARLVRTSGDLGLLMRLAGVRGGSCRPLVVRRQPDGRWLAVIDDLSAGAS